MKPFLLLQSRPEKEADDNEYQSFLKFGGLESGQLVRLALHKGELGEINLDDYSGIIQGGGPAIVSAPPEKKTAAERDYEPKLFALLREVVRRDYPYLGACLGIGYLTAGFGGVVSKKYAEPIGPVTVSLNRDAKSDPLTEGLAERFMAFVGHKEACEVLPPGAVLLANSETCPVQMFRLGKNVYATQFHPELDNDSLELRVRTYQNSGYFDPSELDYMVKIAHSAEVTEPVKILERFVKRYAVNTVTAAGR